MSEKEHDLNAAVIERLDRLEEATGNPLVPTRQTERQGGKCDG